MDLAQNARVGGVGMMDFTKRCGFLRGISGDICHEVDYTNLPKVTALLYEAYNRAVTCYCGYLQISNYYQIHKYTQIWYN